MKNGKFKKILTIAGNIVLIFVFLVGLLTAISLLPIKNNYKLLAVTSGSMEPTIGVGSLAIVMQTSVYNVGDIITFNQPNATSKKETTTHRIQSISITSGQKVYTTKGDANNANDSQTVKEDQIVGKYRFSIALVGYLLKYIKTLPGLLLIIVIPSTVIIYEEARKIAKEMREIRAKRKLNKSPKKEKDE